MAHNEGNIMFVVRLSYICVCVFVCVCIYERLREGVCARATEAVLEKQHHRILTIWDGLQDIKHL